jgi:predicted HicB family RNase H-like nuclease
MNEMSYQNYSARIEYDPIDKIFVGHIVGIRDIVSFHGSTVEELESAFHEAVRHYLEVCEKIGQEPQRSYSGKLTLRVSPEIHMAVATAAELNRKSINQWAADVLKKAAISESVA